MFLHLMHHNQSQREISRVTDVGELYIQHYSSRTYKYQGESFGSTCPTVRWWVHGGQISFTTTCAQDSIHPDMCVSPVEGQRRLGWPRVLPHCSFWQEEDNCLLHSNFGASYHDSYPRKKMKWVIPMKKIGQIELMYSLTTQKKGGNPTQRYLRFILSDICNSGVNRLLDLKVKESTLWFQ